MSKSRKPNIVSRPSIYRYIDPDNWESPLREESLEKILGHINRYLGSVDTIFHEILSDTVHLEVLIIKPNETYPFIRLLTSGMSYLAMTVPEGLNASRYAELMITLPAQWRMDQESCYDERWYWPLRLIKFLARFPHKADSWLGVGHTVPHGDPPEPYDDSVGFCGAMLLPPLTTASEFRRLRVNDEKEIEFLAVVPLFEEEMSFKQRNGVIELADKLINRDISDLIDIRRPNVCA